MNNENRETGPNSSVRPGVLALAAICIVVLVVFALVLHKRKTPGETNPLPAVANTSENASSTESAQKPTAAAATHPPAANQAVKAGAGATLAQSVSLTDLLAALKDPSRSLADRKKALQALVRLGTPEAWGAVRDALASGSSQVRAAAAEALGECSSAECAGMLAGLINDPDTAVANAALKALGRNGSPEAAATLTKVMNDASRTTGLRGEAAVALGQVNQPGVFESLRQAALTLNETDIVEQVLSALGGRNFDETGSFFSDYLHSPTTLPEMKVAALEALAQAQGNPTTFLTSMLSDGDADVRIAAAWALSATEATGSAGPELLSALRSEQDPDVRARMYQALGNQESVDPTTLLSLAQAEKDPDARLAALNAIAKTLRNNPGAQTENYFQTVGVPELKHTALTGETPAERLKAVLALTQAGDVSSLKYVYDNATDPKVKNAAASPLSHPEILAGLAGNNGKH